MRILGIDYGSKRIGLAVSDETGTFAQPVSVVPTQEAITKIKELKNEYGFSMVVLGESKDYKGEDNPIMRDVRAFEKKLKVELGLTVVYEPEFMTSAQAEHIQGRTPMHDASAAALILQSYLDKIKTNDDTNR